MRDNLKKKLIINPKGEFEKMKNLLNLATTQVEQIEDTLNQIRNFEITIECELAEELKASNIKSGVIKASSIHSARLLQ